MNLGKFQYIETLHENNVIERWICMGYWNRHSIESRNIKWEQYRLTFRGQRTLYWRDYAFNRAMEPKHSKSSKGKLRTIHSALENVFCFEFSNYFGYNFTVAMIKMLCTKLIYWFLNFLMVYCIFRFYWILFGGNKRNIGTID